MDYILTERANIQMCLTLTHTYQVRKTKHLTLIFVQDRGKVNQQLGARTYRGQDLELSGQMLAFHGHRFFQQRKETDQSKKHTYEHAALSQTTKKCIRPQNNHHQNLRSLQTMARDLYGYMVIRDVTNPNTFTNQQLCTGISNPSRVALVQHPYAHCNILPICVINIFALCNTLGAVFAIVFGLLSLIANYSFNLYLLIA